MNSMNTFRIPRNQTFNYIFRELILYNRQYYKNSGISFKMKSQIIPQFDSPRHQMSWGMTKELADIMMMYGSTIKQYGVIDPTLDKTYQVLESQLRDLYLLFQKVNFVNFAGDEKTIQSYYRKRQKQLCKEVINAELDIIYPFRIEDNLALDKDDIIHLWGYTDQLPDVANKLNRILLIDYFPLFIDAGFGNAFGNPYFVYHTWKEIYKLTPSLPEGSLNIIIGGGVSM